MLFILEILYCVGPLLQCNGDYIHYNSWQVSLVLTRAITLIGICLFDRGLALQYFN